MSKSQAEIISAAIDDLEHFRRRIGMYIPHADVEKTAAFLVGFKLGLGLAGIRPVKDA